MLMKNALATLCFALCFVPSYLPGQEPKSDKPVPQVAPPKGENGPPANPHGPGGELEIPKELLEEIFKGGYDEVWQMIADNYYNPDKLKAWGDWKNKYNGKLKSKEDMFSANGAAVDSIGDPYTKFFSPEYFKKQAERAHARLVPLGLDVVPAGDGQYKLDDLMFGSEAYSSDLRKGDIITSIGSKKLKGMKPAEVDDLLYDKAGQSVEVVYNHDGKEDKVKLNFKRPVARTVEGRVLDDGILYLRLPDVSSVDVVSGALAAFDLAHKNTEGGVKGILLDVRGNPGGDFYISRRVASIFIKEGVLCTKYSRVGTESIEEIFKALPPLPHMLKAEEGQEEEVKAALKLLELLRTLPMVVVTNNFTASGAEVLTGALKDSGRATVIGEQTYGKGVGYSSYRVMSGTLQITNMEYATPSGYKPQGKGIAPHKLVAQPRGAKNDVQLDAAVKELQKKLAPKGK